MTRKSGEDLTQGKLLPGIIRFVLPVIATGVLQLLFNAADLVVVGQFCGSNSVAAVGATSTLNVLIVNFFLGISVGGGVCVAQAIGAKDDTRVHETVHTAIPLALIFGVVVTVIGIVFAEPLLRMMDTPESVLPLSVRYMRIVFCGQLFHVVYNYGAAILRAAGNTKGPLIYLTSAGGLNFVMNVILVTFLDMDVAGVALATASSYVLSAVLVVRALLKREDACRFRFRWMKIRKAPLLRMLKIGVPAALNGIMFSVANVLCQSSVNSFGDIAVAGNAAAASIGGFVYTSMNAFHQTALNFTGQNAGAKKYDRVRKVMFYCMGCALVLGFILGGLVNLFARPLLGIYLSDAPASVAMGVIRLRYVCLLYFLCGLQEVTVGVLRGMGYSSTPLMASLVGVVFVRIGWILTVFQAYRRLEVLYLSFPLSWTVVLVVNLILVAIVLKKKRKLKYD